MDVGRTAVSLFGLSVHWYGVLIVLGIAAGIALGVLRERKLGLPKDTTLDIGLICVPAAIVGARLYYVAFSWEDYMTGPWWRVFAVWEGGLAIYGGIIGGLLAGVVYARVKKLAFSKLIDLAAPGFPIGQAIGRWGNFVNQEAHGGLVTNPALKFFPAAVEIGGEWYYATFFYESMWCFLICAFVLIAERRHWFRRSGDAFFTYAFLYALERAVVEGLRTDSLYLGPMRVSQGLSLLAALTIALMWAIRCSRTPKALRVIAPACVFAGIAAAVSGSLPGTFAAAAVSLVAVPVMYGWDQFGPKNRNRGEEA